MLESIRNKRYINLKNVLQLKIKGSLKSLFIGYRIFPIHCFYGRNY